MSKHSAKIVPWIFGVALLAEATPMLAETVSTPMIEGPTFGCTFVTYTFEATGATSSEGHPLQYQFSGSCDICGNCTNWSDDEWQDSRFYDTAFGECRTWCYRARARCSIHTSVISDWSPTHSIAITCCDDGQFCNGTETCVGGTCVHSGDPCDGGAECADSCNETTDNCYDQPGTPCGDLSNTECDNPDTCNGSGICLPNQEPNGTTCNDALFCNGVDTCSGGSCSVHSGDPCAGGLECADSCNEAAGNCYDLAGAPCTDDGEQCTNDECDGAGSCTHPNKPDGTLCDDGDPATCPDTCANGVCSGPTCCFLIGGAVYSDLDDPFGSGEEGVEVCVMCEAPPDDRCVVTAGGQGLWQIDSVPPGTCELTVVKVGFTFQHVVGGIPGDPPPITIIVDGEHLAENQSIQFLATLCVGPEILHTETFQLDPDVPQTRPCSGYMDPRIESQDCSTITGLTEVFFLFSTEVFGDEVQGALAPANFVVSTTGDGPVPTIESVDKDPLSVGEMAHVRVTLAGNGITALQEWTMIEANVFDAQGCPISDSGNHGDLNETDRIDIGMLPGDVNQSGECSVLDILNFRQFAISNAYDPACGTQLDHFDISRNGALDLVLDFLRLRQIFFGACPATMNWTGQTMNSPRP